MQATFAVEKYRKAFETLKKGKPYLEKMDLKAQQIIKEASLMTSFNVDSIKSNVANIHKTYQDTYSKIVDKIQLYETQVIIWKQIDDAKHELLRWLNDTNESLKVTSECFADAENGKAKLLKFREELPAYEILQQGILSKTEQLLKLNHGADIPTLTSLNQVLNEEFKLLHNTADTLEKMTSSFAEKEIKIRQDLKQSSDVISKIREEIIKCDDLTGENSKIIERINRCKKLKNELHICDSILENANQKLSELSVEYPSISKSSLPKELQSLKTRRDTVASHADKVSNNIYDRT
jgi:nesprin-1